MKKAGKMGKRIRLLFLLLAAVLLAGCASGELYQLREEAVKEYQAGNYEKARALFDEALSYGNGEVSDVEMDILLYRAECELRCRDYQAAENTYSILKTLDDSAENRALYSGLQEQFDRVREINEAFELMTSGDYRKAYEAVDRYAGLGGDTAAAMAWYNKAVCAEYLGRWEEARNLFADYVAIYPEDAEAVKELEFLKTR